MSDRAASALLASPAAALALRSGPLPTAAPTGSSHAERAQAAGDFEAYLIRMLLGEMQRGVESGGLFGADKSLQGYTSLVQDALARRAAQAGGLGLARQLLASWEREP